MKVVVCLDEKKIVPYIKIKRGKKWMKEEVEDIKVNANATMEEEKICTEDGGRGEEERLKGKEGKKQGR